jgi:4-hydroxy-tetrahydrodipicolinate reductase
VISVGVVGAAGRMGRMVCAAVAEEADLGLVAAVDRSRLGEPIGLLIGKPLVEVLLTDELQVLLEAEAEVVVDFTHPEVVMENLRWYISHAVNAVVGTTGIADDQLGEISKLLEQEGSESNVIVAPNFAVGAVLMQRFAVEASKHLPSAEIVELHHDGKADAPSGTAISTAKMIGAARAGIAAPGPDDDVPGARGAWVDGVRIHSVRLPGLVAHQEVILGAAGQTLTIRHDSMDRTSFMPGVLMAIRQVGERPGLTIGLDPLLEG